MRLVTNKIFEYKNKDKVVYVDKFSSVVDITNTGIRDVNKIV